MQHYIYVKVKTLKKQYDLYQLLRALVNFPMNRKEKRDLF